MLKNLLRSLGGGGTPTAEASAANPLLEFALDNVDGRAMEKWTHYFDVYHRHFARFRNRAVTMLEIGIFNGGSLRMWKDYFGQDSTIVGVDVNPECARYAEPGVEIVIGDQGDRGFLRELRSRYPGISVLVDDGGHHMTQQIATFEELYPHMLADAVYLCEDVHTSYLPHFGGALGDAGTFVEMTKALIDRLNAWHVPNQALAPDGFTRSTDSIHFYDSVVVIERGARDEPQVRTYGSLRDFRYVAPSVAGR